MKAITLYQPHATLMAIGAKMIETRPKKWAHRGLVAIHSGLSTDWLDLCGEEPFQSVLAAAGYHGPADLPFGKVIAISNMATCAPSERFAENGQLWVGPAGFGDVVATMTDQERAFGNYAPGRFGYVFSEIRKLNEPIPCSGHQGYWNLPAAWCDGCDGTGLMEGWSRRDGYSCPKCHGNAITLLAATPEGTVRDE